MENLYNLRLTPSNFPNLYAFAGNNPINGYDAYGLNGIFTMDPSAMKHLANQGRAQQQNLMAEGSRQIRNAQMMARTPGAVLDNTQVKLGIGPQIGGSIEKGSFKAEAVVGARYEQSFNEQGETVLNDLGVVGKVGGSLPGGNEVSLVNLEGSITTDNASQTRLVGNLTLGDVKLGGQDVASVINKGGSFNLNEWKTEDTSNSSGKLGDGVLKLSGQYVGSFEFKIDFKGIKEQVEEQ